MKYAVSGGSGHAIADPGGSEHAFADPVLVRCLFAGRSPAARLLAPPTPVCHFGTKTAFLCDAVLAFPFAFSLNLLSVRVLERDRYAWFDLTKCNSLHQWKGVPHRLLARVLPGDASPYLYTRGFRHLRHPLEATAGGCRKWRNPRV